MKISAENVLFLMDYAFLKKEDIKLNNVTFRWTDRIQPLLKAKEIQLLKDKEFWIYKLRERRGKFSMLLNECLGKVKEFKQKDRVADAETYIAELEKISNNIEEFNKEVKNQVSLKRIKTIRCIYLNCLFRKQLLIIKKEFWILVRDPILLSFKTLSTLKIHLINYGILQLNCIDFMKNG